MYYVYDRIICDDVFHKAGCIGSSGVYRSQFKRAGSNSVVFDVLSDLSVVQLVYRMLQKFSGLAFLCADISLWIFVVFDRTAGSAAVYAHIRAYNLALYPHGDENFRPSGRDVYGAVCDVL